MVNQQASSEVPNAGKVWKSLRWWEKLKVDLGGAVPIGEYTKPGWPGSAMFYIFRCGDCGELNIDYRHGFNGYLSCSRCKRL